MEAWRLVKSIEKKFNKNNETFFSYAWRDKVGEILKDESKYARLVDWIDEQIEINLRNINIFNPADKNKNYSKADFNTYLDSCRDLSLLINLKWIMLDSRSSSEIRENIEYAICSHFKIHFNDKLNKYI